MTAENGGIAMVLGGKLSVPYQLPITSYQLPSYPLANSLFSKQLDEVIRSRVRGDRRVGGGSQPLLFGTVYFPIKDRAGSILSALHPPYLTYKVATK